MKKQIHLTHDSAQRFPELVLLGGSGDGEELPRRPDGRWPLEIHSTTGEIWIPVHPPKVSLRGLRHYEILGQTAEPENQ